MKKDSNKERELFLPLYLYANNEISFLRSYYVNTSSKVIKQRLETENLYQSGEKIDSLIESVINREKEILSIDTDKLREVNNAQVAIDVKFCDVVESLDISDDKKRVKFKFQDKYKNNNYFNPNVARAKYKEAQRMESIFFRSVITDLIVTYESLLSKLLNVIILKNPFPYLDGETVPLASYFLNDTFKAISEKIENVVDKKMYDSLKTMSDIITTEKIDIDKEVLTSFKEIYFRRNAIIHNDCKVNKQYLNSVSPEFRKNIKIGDVLPCDQIYLDKAFNTIYGIYFFLFYGLLKNYYNGNEYISVISNVAFSHLKEKDYEIAKMIYKKLSTNNSIDFADKMLYRINYLNAVKQPGENDILENEIKTLDVSIATDNYKIAKLCLLDDNEGILSMLRKTYPESFTASEIKEWPIFINFRESTEYTAFCSEHTEDFSSEEISTDDNIEAES